MRLRHIEVFHAVMQAGSLSKAAELLCISQPAASKMLANAEHSLGVALFTRAHGQLRPTREAELLFAETKGLHERLESVRRLARNLSARPGGHLRVGCVPSIGLSLLPEAVARFARQYPEVSLSILTDHTEELCSALLARELDIGIAFAPPVRAGIQAMELGRARLAYLGSSDETPAEGMTFRLADMQPERWIGLDPADPLGALIDRQLREMGLDPRAPAIEVRTYYLARALVDCGAGYAIVDEFTAAAGRENRPLTYIEPELSIGVFSLLPASGTGSHAQQVLIDLLRARLAERSAS
jgi:DNA-binding transcriptional LysR family regulator